MPRRLLRQGLALTLVFASVTCTDTTGPTPSADGPRLFRTPTGLVSSVAPETFVGAGDIASCKKTGDSQTAALLDTIPGKIFLLGDNVYDKGTTSEFANCFDPTWGRHKARMHPSAGNHEYNTSNATPYYAYFGAAAGDPTQGYYSFELGAWHVIVLNSNISKTTSSPQLQWLRADLAANQNLCTVAYFHHPLYSSTGGSGSGGATYSSVRPFYDELYQAGADLVMAGHRHFYERLAKLRPDGSRDNLYGTRHVIAGMGGIGNATLSNVHPASEVRSPDTFGVLKLYLYEDSYAWKFIPVAGKTFTDSGSSACHTPPPSGSGGVSASLSTVAASPPTLTASNGSSLSTITVTVKSGAGAAMSGASVVLSATGTGNVVTQPSGPTDASGVATGTLSSVGAGPKTVSATANGTGITQKPVVTVNPAAKTALGFQVQPGNTNRNESISPAVQVQIRDQFGNRISGATDDVTIAIGNNPSGGTLGGTTTVAAVDGTASFANLTIDNAATGYTLVATASGLSNATSDGFNIIVPPPTISAGLSTVAAAPSSISAGTGTSTVTVTVKDPGGVAIPGVVVALSATGTGNTVGQPSGPTDANGVATGTLRSTVAGPKTVTAVAGGVTLSQQPVVTVDPGPPDQGQSTVAAAPGAILVGSGVSTVSVTVKDAYGNRLSGVDVALSATGTDNTLGQPSGPTNSNGVATGTLSSSAAEPKTVSATAGGTPIAQTATVNVVTDQPATISHSLLTVGADPVNQKVFTTAAIFPAPDALVTVAVLSHRTPSATASPTLSGGGMSTWTEVATVTFDTLAVPLKRVTIFRAMSAAPGSGPITITFANGVSNAEWIVSQWDGVETSGSNGAGAIVQTGSARQDDGNGLTVALASFENENSVAYGAFGVSSRLEAVTPGSGFTEIAEQTSTESTPASLQAQWATNRSTIAATWAGLKGGALGVELRARIGP